MAWDGKVTNVGLSLLEQWGTGSQTLHIDKATIGTGTVPSASLIASTTVAGEIGETPITGSSVVTGGIQYQVQVQPQTAAYTLHQIGVWGHLGDSGTATLIAVFQEADGINIPAEADEPGYALTVYCAVAMSNTGSITINLSGGAYVTLDMLNALSAETVKSVNTETPDANGNVTLPTDSTPTSNSNNYVTSGGVASALAQKAPLASPALTGTPTAPTAAANTSTTQIATTAFVQNSRNDMLKWFGLIWYNNGVYVNPDQ